MIRIKILYKIRNSSIYRTLSLFVGSISWAKRNFASPSPQFIKHKCLIRNGFNNAIWVESGTYLGQTTQVLANKSIEVFSIEPEPILFIRASKYFSKNKKITILKGVSEEVLPNLLPKLKGNINFWLDGHFSSGFTFKGTQITPIIDELKAIEDNLNNYNNICICIDDIRDFQQQISKISGYPDTNYLVAWANKNNFLWQIEHDIFIMKREI